MEALRATGLLREFNAAGVLDAADVHVARRIAALAAEGDERVALAAALAVRAPRLGHVYVDLATIHETAIVESEEPVDLPWPPAAEWEERVAASPLAGGPLHLEGTALYLDRYWREENRLAADLLALREAGRLTVIAGGPGTGKTTAVARIVAETLNDSPGLLVALAAPTARAAARLGEVVQEEMGNRRAPEASTVHRLLGTHPRFRHDRGNRLPHDIVVVDETSMVSLSLMARLVAAVRPQARLILVGDPGQLASIEAGAVLGDIVGPGEGEGIVVLETVHRFGGAIARLAEAIRRGDGDGAVAALEGVTWLDGPERVEERAAATAHAVAAAARAGDAPGALQAMAAFRVLCAHRRDVARWTEAIERRLAPDGEWYTGRPLLITANDYGLGLFNGDTGVVLADGSAAFPRRGEVLRFSPSRLGAVDTVHAMTVHKSQGSQYDTAAVVLPEPGSPLLTRELLYTAVTRAREELIVVGGEEAVRAAVARPIARASGLRRRLWGD